MSTGRTWIPAHEAGRCYAYMMEMRNGIRWALVSATTLTDEQRARYAQKTADGENVAE